MGIFQNIIGTLGNVFSIGKINKATLTLDSEGLNIDKRLLAPNAKIGTFSGILKSTVAGVDTAIAEDLIFTPSGDLSSTDVQAALVELDSEKHVRNRAVSLNFNHSDFASGSLLISNVEAKYIVDKVEIEITSEFDGIPLVTVGDDSNHFSVCPSTSSDLTAVFTYEEISKKICGVSTDIKIYFSGEPTQGSGTVTIFLSGNLNTPEGYFGETNWSSSFWE